MKLGFAVKILGAGGLPSQDTRRWQSGPHLRVSLEYLRAILAYLEDSDIRMYRVTSSLAPYATHPDLPQFHGQVAECAAELAELGAAVRGAGVRLSSHPGQYIVQERKKRVGRRVERSLVLPQLRAHADMLDPIAFEHFLSETATGLEFDVMLEAKAKDLALLRLREQLGERGIAVQDGELRAPLPA